MKTIIGIEDIEPIKPYPVVAIGNFDGLHLGHQAILKQTIERAKANHGTSVVLTFKPHPSHILSPDQPTLLLTPFEEKVNLLRLFGIDVLIYAEFNKEFAHQTPFTFAQNLLFEKIGCKEVVVGERFAFGKNRAGKVVDLTELGKQFGFQVTAKEDVLVNDARVSSSRIRTLLSEGKVSLASKLLSRPYSLKGTVVHGAGTGGKNLGVPTANIPFSNALIPKEGIYATRTTLCGYSSTPFNSIAYIGSKPTFSKKGNTQIEVHLFDFNKDLYGSELEVAFLEWIRPDEEFPTDVALIKQMKQDMKKARLILSRAAQK